jgi:hypothetical protein
VPDIVFFSNYIILKRRKKKMKNKTNNVSISKGNSKMGGIPSVSLPACVTCNPNAPCFKKCYALRLEKRYPAVNRAYYRNLNILQNNPDTYWQQVKQAAQTARFFRYHVSGDIPNINYLHNMVTLANATPNTKYLAFTKQFTIINEYLKTVKKLPDNLQIILSNWGEWKCDNPHNLPTCEIILKGNKPVDNWKICGGNCTECACRGVGCWELKQGETIAIYEH